MSIFFFLLPVFLSVYELPGALIIVLSALVRLKRTDPKPLALYFALIKIQLGFMSALLIFVNLFRFTW
jgi:hypothetical protein